MLYSLITNGFSDFNLLEFVRDMLISIVPFLLALSLHEAAHAFVAYKCGDPTAKYMGRLTVNPLKHLDPMGLVMMFVVGLGWAKAVPVDPRNFRHGRRDDLKVSLAGIAANCIMCLIGCAGMYAFVFAAIRKVPDYDTYTWQEYFQYAYNINEYLITPMLGKWVGYIYEMVTVFATVNLSLALFNLLPVPPLDGYHVLNDLVLKKSLFASRDAMQIGRAVLVVLLFTGWLDKGLSFLLTGAFSGLGSLAHFLLRGLL